MEGMQEEHHHQEEFLKLLFRGILPSVFFIGGVVVLVSRIPVWSLLLGLPMTLIGSAILLYALDDIARNTILPRPHLTACSVCKKPTPVVPGIPENKVICASCMRQIREGSKSQ